MDHTELEKAFLKLDKDFRRLCGLFAAQQAALEKLKVAVDGHQTRSRGCDQLSATGSRHGFYQLSATADPEE